MKLKSKPETINQKQICIVKNADDTYAIIQKDMLTNEIVKSHNYYDFDNICSLYNELKTHITKRGTK